MYYILIFAYFVAKFQEKVVQKLSRERDNKYKQKVNEKLISSFR